MNNFNFKNVSYAQSFVTKAQLFPGQVGEAKCSGLHHPHSAGKIQGFLLFGKNSSGRFMIDLGIKQQWFYKLFVTAVLDLYQRFAA